MTRPDPLAGDAIATAYLTYMRDVEKTPDNTIKARLRTLRSVGNPGTATRDQVETWWKARADLKPSTRTNDLANLRSFYKWAAIWEHRSLADDPTLRIKAPKQPKGAPGWVSKPDLTHLLNTLPEDLARAVCLGAYAGVRVSEAAALHWTHIDAELNLARIYGKGSKYRVIKISPLLVDKLLPDTGGNVVTGAEPMSGAVLQRRVNRAIRAAGVDATFHKLRHRYGTVALQATGDIVAVAKQMGHASITTTAGYAAAASETADKIAAAVMQ